MFDSITLKEFAIGKATHHIFNGNKSFALNIPLHRMVAMQMVNTFFPTSCLLTVACLTLFVAENHFKTTATLCLTTMLVMYTLLQRIESELPKTAYIKMVDIWLIVGMSVPFMVFVFVVATELAPEKVIAKNTCANPETCK